MDKKPRFLIDAVSWNEKRNLLFLYYLTEYFEVTILTSFKGDKEFFASIKPVKAFFVKFRFNNKTDLPYSGKLKYYLNEYKSDFVLTLEPHSVSSYQSVKLSKKFNFKHIVFCSDNTVSRLKHFITKSIQKKVIAWSSYLQAGTPGIKNYLLKIGADPGKIFINPESGYDEKIFTATGDNLRKEWGMEPYDVVVLYAGKFTKEKGIKSILNAAKKIETANTKNKFVFAGRGELENRIRIFDSQNLYFRVFYNFTDMGKVIRSCNILVYPGLSTKYLSGQFDYSIIEEQACGKPVIISNSGNQYRFVNDGINGSIIREEEDQALTEKILLWYDKLQIDSEINEISASKFSGKNIALNYNKILLDNDHLLLNDWF